MIRIANAQLWVHDQDEALAFYTEKLGFSVQSDVTVARSSSRGWDTTSTRTGPDRWRATRAGACSREMALSRSAVGEASSKERGSASCSIERLRGPARSRSRQATAASCLRSLMPSPSMGSATVSASMRPPARLSMARDDQAVAPAFERRAPPPPPTSARSGLGGPSRPPSRRGPAGRRRCRSAPYRSTGPARRRAPPPGRTRRRCRGSGRCRGSSVPGRRSTDRARRRRTVPCGAARRPRGRPRRAAPQERGRHPPSRLTVVRAARPGRR